MSKNKQEIKSTKITIEFSNPKAAEHFASWLCGAGEQDYWQWMEAREEDEDGDITAIEFRYHGPEDETKSKTDSTRYGKFMCDNSIRTTCSRLDKQ
jgi:hypothetical protein